MAIDEPSLLPPGSGRVSPTSTPPGESDLVRAAAATDDSSPLPYQRTLEEELQAPPFMERGWERLTSLASYVVHLVDGRTLGVLAADHEETFARVVGLASVLKAAAQWFALDTGRPKFVVAAEKYLEESAHGRPIDYPVGSEHRSALRTGPVATRKGAQGSGGRLHSLAKLKADIELLVSPLVQEDIHTHLEACRDRSLPKPKEGWYLPQELAVRVLLSFMYGTLADLLRKHDVPWHFEAHVSAVTESMLGVLEHADISHGPGRQGRIEELAQRAIGTLKKRHGEMADGLLDLLSVRGRLRVSKTRATRASRPVALGWRSRQEEIPGQHDLVHHRRQRHPYRYSLLRVGPLGKKRRVAKRKISEAELARQIYVRLSHVEAIFRVHQFVQIDNAFSPIIFPDKQRHEFAKAYMSIIFAPLLV